jgi:hypothetical protein
MRRQGVRRLGLLTVIVLTALLLQSSSARRDYG